MDTEKMPAMIDRRQVDEEGNMTTLPGFRFHPTDEELVEFYLRRKVDKKQLNIDHLIRQIDIYKYDPWDLPLANYEVGDKEWYFFCRRGRKYRNSIRPNRVTCSGFWKATGIDRPVYSGDGLVCVGLKKSLVYYRGSAGKGTKTEWMMHEFRLSPSSQTNISTKNIKNMDDKAISQEAEVWTLCRILKRKPSPKKTIPGLKELPPKQIPVLHRPKTFSEDSSDHDMKSYISFQRPIIQVNRHQNHLINGANPDYYSGLDRFASIPGATNQAPSATASSSSFSDLDNMDEIIEHGDWDDLRSVVEFATADRQVLFM